MVVCTENMKVQWGTTTIILQLFFLECGDCVVFITICHTLVLFHPVYSRLGLCLDPYKSCLGLVLLKLWT